MIGQLVRDDLFCLIDGIECRGITKLGFHLFGFSPQYARDGEDLAVDIDLNEASSITASKKVAFILQGVLEGLATVRPVPRIPKALFDLAGIELQAFPGSDCPCAV